MSMIAKLKSIPRNLPTGVQPGSGLKPFLYDKVERGAMAAALGAVKGYYYDRAVFHGVGVEAWVAVLGYLGAAVFHQGAMGRHLERAGDVGATAYLYALGASWGSDKAGRGVQQTQALPKGKKAVVGAIPPRQGGAFLTADEMAAGTAR